MFRYLVRRILWAMFLFLMITFVTFVIFFMAPNDPARAMCGGDQASEAMPRDCHREARARQADLGPVHEVSRSARRRPYLGYSYATRQSLNETIMEDAPVTASLVIGGAVLWMLIALSVGVYSALRPRSLVDRAAMVFVLSACRLTRSGSG